MKILHIISSLQAGGAQKIVMELATHHKKMGFDVGVLVHTLSFSDFENKIKDNNIDVISLNCKNLYSINCILKIRSYIKHYDIIHVHLFPSLYLVALASLGTSSKLIYTEHSTYNRRRDKKILRPLEKLIYSKYSKIVSISEGVQDNIKNWLCPKKEKKYCVIYNGIDLTTFTNITTKRTTDIFDRKGIPILMVSRFVEAKDQETVIRAIQYIDNPEVFIAFAGAGDNLRKCKELSKALNVSDKCVFLGNRDDIPDLVMACKLGVQSSNWEGFGLTAVEFMACKKPIIASNNPGLAEVVKNYGILFKSGNEVSLAGKINEILSDEKLYNEISKRCYNRSKDFDIELMTKSYLDIYKTLL